MKLDQIENIPSNYYEHRKEALLWIQKLSGQLWTDFNPHDPGVTILEVLSYALTELDYKLGFTIEDILHSSVVKKGFQLKDNALFLAEDIFCTAPVTKKDFRILLIDQIHGVTNAWLFVENQDKGLFNLTVQLNSEAEPELIKREVFDLFNEYKVVGWSLKEVKVIQKKDVELSGNFYFQSDESAEKLLASVFYEFNEKLINIKPTSQTFDKLWSDGKPLNEIFDGPKVENGIIEKEDLKPFHNEIQLQTINGALNKLKGVLVISDISIKMGGKVYTKVIPTEDNLPYINPRKNHNIRVYNDGKPAEIDPEELDYQYHKIDQAVRRNYELSGKKTSSFEFLEKTRNRNIATFYRLMQEFPTIYQIDGSQYREGARFRNKQFKKLLLPFEQFLSNSMKQLAETSTFFSVSNDSEYYNQQVIEDKETKLEKEHVKEIDFLKKRNQVLNHLLARFDSSMNHYLPDLYYGDHIKSFSQRLKCKELLIKDFPDISANKSSITTKHRNGLSYIAYELMLKLWIDKPAERPYHKVISDLKMEFTKLEDDGSIQVKSYLEELFDKNLTEKERRFYVHTDRPLETLLASGLKSSNYSVSKIKEEDMFGLYLSLGDTQLKNLIHKSADRKGLLNEIGYWINLFFDLNKRSEGFYLIDNSLLQSSTLNFSYTVSFIFTAWSKRFQSRNFQQNVEEMIMESMPAHLRIHVIWLNHIEMKLFESEYLDSANQEIPTERLEFSNDLETILRDKMSIETNGE